MHSLSTLIYSLPLLPTKLDRCAQMIRLHDRNSTGNLDLYQVPCTITVARWRRQDKDLDIWPFFDIHTSLPRSRSLLSDHSQFSQLHFFLMRMQQLFGAYDTVSSFRRYHQRDRVAFDFPWLYLSQIRSLTQSIHYASLNTYIYNNNYNYRIKTVD